MSATPRIYLPNPKAICVQCKHVSREFAPGGVPSLDPATHHCSLVAAPRDFCPITGQCRRHYYHTCAERNGDGNCSDFEGYSPIQEHHDIGRLERLRRWWFRLQTGAKGGTRGEAPR